jgi:hypothetical protein
MAGMADVAEHEVTAGPANDLIISVEKDPNCDGQSESPKPD